MVYIRQCSMFINHALISLVVFFYIFFLPSGQHVRGMDPESEKWANILWDYLQMHQPLEKARIGTSLNTKNVSITCDVIIIYITYYYT